MDLKGSWPYIESVARSRLSHNKTERHIDTYGEGIEVIGAAGEIIVRRFLGLPEQVHDHFDHGIDLEYYGLTVDVKATILTPNAPYRYLQWPNWKKLRADIVVMTAIDPLNRLGTVIGYARKDEILRAPLNPNRPTPCREIPFPHLHPAWELVVEGCYRQTQAALGFRPSRSRKRRGGSPALKPSGA